MGAFSSTLQGSPVLTFPVFSAVVKKTFSLHKYFAPAAEIKHPETPPPEIMKIKIVLRLPSTLSAYFVWETIGLKPSIHQRSLIPQIPSGKSCKHCKWSSDCSLVLLWSIVFRVLCHEGFVGPKCCRRMSDCDCEVIFPQFCAHNPEIISLDDWMFFSFLLTHCWFHSSNSF